MSALILSQHDVMKGIPICELETLPTASATKMEPGSNFVRRTKFWSVKLLLNVLVKLAVVSLMIF